MTLDEYILLTRTLSSNSPPLEAMYAKYYKIILSIFGNSPSLPKLKVIYSLQRSAEIIDLSGKEFLIYDQYLGQTFNMLNRILLNSTDTMDSEMYFFKLLSERFAVKGENKIAQLLAYMHHIMKGKYFSYKSDKDILQRAIFTYSQEVFIISHEIAHLLIENPQNYREFFSRISFSDDFNLDNPSHFIEIVNNMSNLFGLGPIDYKGLDLITSIFKNKLTKELVIECYCDTIATLVTILVLNVKQNMDINNVILGIVICLRHLRVIGVINDICSNLWEKSKITSNDIHLTMNYIPRTSNIRGLISSFKNNFKQTVNYADIVELADHYEIMIEDPLMLSVSDKLKTLQRSLVENQQDIVDDANFTLTDVIKTTGFL